MACFRFFTTGPDLEPECKAPVFHSFMTPAMSFGIDHPQKKKARQGLLLNGPMPCAPEILEGGHEGRDEIT
jgi:hypothetical protein